MRAATLRSLALAFLPLPLAAQTEWVGPQPPCDIKPGHFRLNSVPVNFKAAYEKPAQRDRMLSQTLNVLTRSITQDQQDQNPAAWYSLGRYYVEMGDATGADSAFDRAVTLAPQCTADVDGYRRALWADVYAAGSAHPPGGQGRLSSAAIPRGVRPPALRSPALLRARRGVRDA